MTIDFFLVWMNFKYVLVVTKIMNTIILILVDVLEAMKITNSIKWI